MIRVAICDDDIVFTTRVEELILDFGRAYSFEICIYFDGYTLLESMRQGNCFDIIFMDIEMKQIDGIRAAKTIREIDEDVQLIYISGYEEYALQSSGQTFPVSLRSRFYRFFGKRNSRISYGPISPPRCMPGYPKEVAPATPGRFSRSHCINQWLPARGSKYRAAQPIV